MIRVEIDTYDWWRKIRVLGCVARYGSTVNLPKPPIIITVPRLAFSFFRPFNLSTENPISIPGIALHPGPQVGIKNNAARAVYWILHIVYHHVPDAADRKG